MTTKKTSSKKSVAKKPCEAKKATCKKTKSAAPSKGAQKSKKVVVVTQEITLKKLTKAKVLDKFVKSNNGSWDHQMWEEFCCNIQLQGFHPIDLDKVGLLLEEKKREYFMN